jgi:putative membrane protein
MAMGAADIVPGVSGGTIALITGIYDRLIRAIVSADGEALAMLLGGRWRDLWYRLDGAFLSVLLSGILVAIFTLASGIHWLLSAYPQPLWAFFSGLILASGLMLLRNEVLLDDAFRITSFAAGVSAAVAVSFMPPVAMMSGLPGLFIAGAVAICAMILPGISGSFMLVLMGMYSPVLAAVKGFHVGELAVLAAGCVTGLLCFARLLDRLLRRHRLIAMAFLSGVLMGSLVTVWPWRATVTGTGGETALITRPVWPVDVVTPQLGLCVIAFVAGLVLVFGVQWLGSRRAR